MPMHLKAWSNDSVPSAAEARELLADAELREAQAKSEADALRTNHEHAVEQLTRDMGTPIADYERQVKQALAEAKVRSATETPSIASRGSFRAMFAGVLANAELISAETRAAYTDPLAASLLGLSQEGQRLMERLIAPSSPVRLPESDPLVARLDRAECACWSTFMERARRCAGEASLNA